MPLHPHHRRCLVLAGPRAWGLAEAARVLAHPALSPRLWIAEGGSPPAGTAACAPARARGLLGQEAAGVLLDLHDGPDPDLIGAVPGTVVGGGLLILLTPALDQWGETPDGLTDRLMVVGWPRAAITRRFVRRLINRLQAHAWINIRGPEDPPATWPLDDGGATPRLHQGPGDEPATGDQARAAATVERAVTGRARRPVVLIADRGRGKSAALGLAAGRVLRAGLDEGRPRTIIVTAASRAAAGAVFTHARACLPSLKRGQGDIDAPGASMRFLSPGDLLDQAPEADLVLVDEAATLPLPHLETLLERHPRIAFATTVHGYEGTGRGFLLRFPKLLDARARGWRRVRMTTPIRWAPQDPLEAFTFDALLLDATREAGAPPEMAAPADRTITRVDRTALSEALLAEVFGLLVSAHYRTGPADLMRLLDAPNVELFVLQGPSPDQPVLGAAMITIEGGLPPDLGQATWLGQRRPAGHMLPETLACHSNLPEATAMRLARVVRVAVHPALQGGGLGSRLLGEVTRWAKAEGLDALGSVFGATASLLRFWSRAGYAPVRLGITRGRSSGVVSAVVVQPVSAEAKALFEAEPARFAGRLPDQLCDPLRDLEPEVVLACLAAVGPLPEVELEARDRWTLVMSALGTRDPVLDLAPIKRAILAGLASPQVRSELTEAAQRLLVVKGLQGWSWAEAAERCGLRGRSEAMQQFKRALGPLALAFAMETAQRWVELKG